MHLDVLFTRATGKEPTPFWDGPVKSLTDPPQYSNAPAGGAGDFGSVREVRRRP
jgi:hypothetical protein